jgi:hypothetical protein
MRSLKPVAFLFIAVTLGLLPSRVFPGSSIARVSRGGLLAPVRHPCQ